MGLTHGKPLVPQEWGIGTCHCFNEIINFMYSVLPTKICISSFLGGGGGGVGGRVTHTKVRHIFCILSISWSSHTYGKVAEQDRNFPGEVDE